MTASLPRAESPLIDELYEGLVTAVKQERISIETVDQAIFHNVKVKSEYGILDAGGLGKPEQADEIQRDADARAVELRIGQAAIVLLRDEPGTLPVATGRRVLLVDQTGPNQLNVNNFLCHPGTLWEKMLSVHDDVSCVEIDGEATPDDAAVARVMRRVNEADVIVATNSPFSVDPEFKTVLIAFADTHAACQALSEIIFGERQATGVLSITAGLRLT